MPSLNLLFDPFEFYRKFFNLSPQKQLLLNAKAASIFVGYKLTKLLPEFPNDITELSDYQLCKLRYLASTCEPIKPNQ